MRFFEYLNLFGVDAKQIPCIKGEGAPTAATEGDVGCLYMNIRNGDLYKCIRRTASSYIWKAETSDFANALKANVKGETITIDDISPVEHTVDIKVESSSNYFNALAIALTEAWADTTCISSVSRGSITITTQSAYSGNGYCATNKTLKEICPMLEVGKTYTLNATSGARNQWFYFPAKSFAWIFGESAVITEELLNCAVVVYGYNSADTYGDCVISNIRVTEAGESTDYAPYIDPTAVTVFVNGTPFTPNVDGAVLGVISIAPKMTFSTDTEGAIITVKCNLDINAIFAQEMGDNEKKTMSQKAIKELFNSGFVEVNNANILPPDYTNGYIDATTGAKVTSANHVTTPDFVPLVAGTTSLYVRVNDNNDRGLFLIAYYGDDGEYLGNVNDYYASYFNTGFSVAVPVGATKFKVYISAVNVTGKTLADVCVSYNALEAFEEYGKHYEIPQNTLSLSLSSMAAGGLSRLLLGDKIIVNLGDSIFGNNDTETGVTNLMREIIGGKLYNCAFGGTRGATRPEASGYEQFDFESLVNCIINNDYTALENAVAQHSMPVYFASRIERIKAVNWEEVDIVTLNYGTNDYSSGMAKNRYVAGYTEAISTLQTAFPNLKVVLISPTWRVWYAANDGTGTYLEDSDSKDWGGGTLIDYCDSLKNIANELHVNYIDAYNIGINKHNYSEYFSATDGTHHDVAGRRLLAEYLARQLIALG